MLSSNEWDPLKSVIVGIADDARIPWLDPSLRYVNYASTHDTKSIPKGPYPQQVIEEANEDLETFCDFLRKESITVYRPDKKVKPKYYNYCPRDTVLVHKDLILATPIPLKARLDEYKAMEDILSQHGNITVAPRHNSYRLYNTKCLGNPTVLALYERDPAFDAANILRANDDLFYLVSNSGNHMGVTYLRELVQGKGIRVHTLTGIYSYMHLDSTITFLREGLMLLNPERIRSVDQLPEHLRKWDVIWCPEPVDIGHYPGFCNSSPWINMNLLSINPRLVVLEKHQEPLRRKLENYGIECAMLPMRHARTLGGCFHCVTLDLERNT